MICHVSDQAAPQDRVTAKALQLRVRRDSGDEGLIISKRYNSATTQNDKEKSCPSCPTREPIDPGEVAV